MLTKPDPIMILEKMSDFQKESLNVVFMQMLRHLYQYNCLKPLMDLSATKCQQELLRFKVQDRQFFDLDEGNCMTIESVSINNLLNKFKQKKRYVITIKKLGYDVIIHEIAHMLEREVELPLHDFSSVLLNNLKRAEVSNITLKATIKKVLFEEVSHYQKSHVQSELFARYFQVIAMSKDISGFSSVTGYRVKDVLEALCDTQKWLEENIYELISSKVDAAIEWASRCYIKSIDDVEHRWSEQKVGSIHVAGKAWKKTIQSIKN